MKQLLDFLPLLVFFIVYKTHDIYTASGALVVAACLQIIALRLIYKKVETMHWVGFIFILIFGSLSYVFQDDTYIKWKVTIMNVLFALILLGGQLLKKPILKQMLSAHVNAPDKVWVRLSWAWCGFCVLCAGLNWYVAFHFSQDVWMNFKVFGLMALNVLMTGVTVFYLFKYLPKEKNL